MPDTDIIFIKAEIIESQMADLLRLVNAHDKQLYREAHQQLCYSLRELSEKHNEITDIVITLAIDSFAELEEFNTGDFDTGDFLYGVVSDAFKSCSIGEKKAELFLMPIIINTNNNGEQIYLSKNQMSRILDLFREFDIICSDDRVILNSNILHEAEISHGFIELSEQLNTYLELVSGQNSESDTDDICYMSPFHGDFNAPDCEPFDFSSYLYFIRGFFISKDGLDSKPYTAVSLRVNELSSRMTDILSGDQGLPSISSVDSVLLPLDYKVGYYHGVGLNVDFNLLLFLSQLIAKALKLDCKRKDPIVSVEVRITTERYDTTLLMPDFFYIVITATVIGDITPLEWRLTISNDEGEINNIYLLKIINEIIKMRLEGLAEMIALESQTQNPVKIKYFTDDLATNYLLND